jgi:hypothetical protein
LAEGALDPCNKIKTGCRVHDCGDTQRKEKTIYDRRRKLKRKLTVAKGIRPKLYKSDQESCSVGHRMSSRAAVDSWLQACSSSDLSQEDLPLESGHGPHSQTDLRSSPHTATC